MFLVTFFTKPQRKKHWLSVPDYLTDKGHTELVLSAFFCLLVYQTMIELNSFQLPREFDFP